MSPASYAAPEKLSEVLSLLATNPGSHILAGGQNLLIEPRRKTLGGALLVDVRKVTELAGIEASSAGVRIGATTTLSAIAGNETLRKSYPALAQAAGIGGDQQIRNRATIGGAVAQPDPASDILPVLIVLNATVEVAGPKSRRTSIEELYRTPGARALAVAEIITAITIPSPERRTGITYERIKHPATLFPVCGVAASLTVSDKGTITQARVAVAGSVDLPVSLREVETSLQGATASDDSLVKAADLIQTSLPYRGDHYASSEYRRHLTRVLTLRALKGALQRASS